MYTDQKAPEAIRGQAQALLVFLTQGVGMFFGYKIMGAGKFAGIDLGWTIGDYGKQVTSVTEYSNALTAARGQAPQVSFFETFAKMFSRNLPETLDANLLGKTMGEWKNFWMFPAIMALVIMIVFFLMFWDKAKDTSEAKGH
jgi:hypothetical protein